MTEMQTALAASGRVFKLLDEKVEKPVANPQTIENISGQVCLKDVCFSYNPDISLLKI